MVVEGPGPCADAKPELQTARAKGLWLWGCVDVQTVFRFRFPVVVSLVEQQ